MTNIMLKRNWASMPGSDRHRRTARTVRPPNIFTRFRVYCWEPVSPELKKLIKFALMFNAVMLLYTVFGK